MPEEILIVKKKERDDALKFKVTVRNRNDTRYEKIVPNKDYNHLAELFFDLSRLGYNIDKAFLRYKNYAENKEEPDLFFLNN